MQKDRIDLLGAGLLILISALLGLNQALVKLVNSGMEQMFQVGLRSLCAAPLVIAVAIMRKKRLSFRDGTLLPGIACGLCFALEFLFLFYGLSMTTVARASIIFYTMPVWMAIAAHLLLNERLTPQRIAGLILAMSGLTIAVWSASDGGSSSILGEIFCLIGALFWMALALIAKATRLRRADPEMQLVYQLIVSAPLMLLASMIPGEYAFAMTPTLWTYFAMQVILVSCFAYLTWLWILSVYPASDMASFAFLAPVFGVFFGWSLLGEPLLWSDVAALVLVSVGLVLINRKPKATKGPAHA